MAAPRLGSFSGKMTPAPQALFVNHQTLAQEHQQQKDRGRHFRGRLLQTRNSVASVEILEKPITPQVSQGPALLPGQKGQVPARSQVMG